jgi:hypothetical protein
MKILKHFEGMKLSEKGGHLVVSFESPSLNGEPRRFLENSVRLSSCERPLKILCAQLLEYKTKLAKIHRIV